ncbi:MAG: ribosome biogenesis GTPase Der [Dongiaceae bacterium]
MTAVVAIVGRPNVGKSTLFNRLVGKRIAIVDDLPGVTRDRREGRGRLGDLEFTLIDTAGLEEAASESLSARMQAQTRRAIAEADLVLFVIDARSGLIPDDRHFADLLRRSGKPTLLLANKSESRASEAGRYDAFALGFGEPLAISAEHGDGMSLLLEAMQQRLAPDAPASDEIVAGVADDDMAPPAPDAPIAITFVGRPNVGKSTLVNRLLGEERVITGPEAGITRDAITIDWEYGGRKMRLVDTAGLRRRARISERLEQLSGAETARALKYAQVVVLVLDATESFEKQDLTIAREVLEEGRALVIAANKWDAVAEPDAALKSLKDRIERSLPQARGIPLVTISAEEGEGIARLMRRVFEIYEKWNHRISTGDLNRWLGGITERHPPPMASGKSVKLRYATQIKTRPPTFAIFVNRPTELPDSYLRYLVNGLRDTFGLDGVPLRITLRKGNNPYAGD